MTHGRRAPLNNSGQEQMFPRQTPVKAAAQQQDAAAAAAPLNHAAARGERHGGVACAQPAASAWRQAAAACPNASTLNIS
jgi:hypothetical protein